MNKIYLLALCATVSLFGCKKDAKDNTEITFNNRINKEVILTVYRSREDYGNNANPVMRKVLKAEEVATVPASTLPLGQTYYMDWHSDDKYYNNWFNDDYPQGGVQVSFKPVVGGNTYYIDPSFTGHARQVFLNTDDISSTWQAVNAYMFSKATGYVSFWNSMSEAERYRQIVVRKNFTAEYSYKNGSGQSSTNILSFKVHRTGEAYIEFMDPKAGSLGSLATGMLPTGTPPDYKSTAKDTVLALLPNSDYYFMMVRNK